MLTHRTWNTVFNSEWHLCHYVRVSNSQDDLSKYVINFKNGDNRCVDKWINWSVDELKELNSHFDYVIRVLGSSELTNSGDKPLDKLGKGIQQHLGWVYKPDMIRKTRTTKKLSLTPLKADREAELEGVYILASDAPNLNGKKVLIIDDIATSGTTTGKIAKLIKARYPNCRLSLFTLAHTYNDEHPNEGITRAYFEEKQELSKAMQEMIKALKGL